MVIEGEIDFFKTGRRLDVTFIEKRKYPLMLSIPLSALASIIVYVGEVISLSPSI